MSYAFWNARKRKVSELAEGISGFFFQKAPIDPEIITAEEELTYSYGKYENAFDGLLQHQFGRFHIFINLDRLIGINLPRTRFTFGHELGHYFIDEHRFALQQGMTPSHPSFNRLMAANPIEREADLFASCLLMPSVMFRSQCVKQKLTEKLIEHLSTHFQTSISSVIFRYFELNLHPMALVLSKKGKIEWTMSTSDFYHRPLPVKGDPVPETSVAGEFFLNNKRYNSAEPVFVLDWVRTGESSISPQLNEKCYYLSNDSVLSLIWGK